MSVELKSMLDKLQNEWQEFKSDNLLRMKEIEAKGKADPLTEEKIDKHSAAIGLLEKSIAEMSAKMSRPGVDQSDEKQNNEAHRKAFDSWLRKGDDSKLAEFHQKTGVNVGTDTEGGYLVPHVLDTEIEKYAVDANIMRQECRVVAVGNEEYTKLVKQGTAASGWVDETEARTETATPTWNALKPYFGEIYANPGVTQKALDDAMLNLEAELAEDIGIEFAAQENDAFTSGTGVKKPKGILAYTLAATADATRAFGVIEKVASGSSGAFVATKLIELVYALHPGYRANAKWMISPTGMGAIRKLVDGQNNFLFQPSFIAGQPSSLIGYPIVENPDVPVPGAGANAAIFGDFRRAYYIVDVGAGVRMLRDPYTNKPKVMFYTTKRVGGMLVNSQAVKVSVLT
jgi:HK97 family phage major capsid protein